MSSYDGLKLGVKPARFAHTSGAAPPEEAPNPRVLHNASGAAPPEKVPNPRAVHIPSGAAHPEKVCRVFTYHLDTHDVRIGHSLFY